MKVTISPASPEYSAFEVRTAVTVQREAALDHSALTTRVLSRMWASRPSSATVSRMYSRIESPSAMAFASVQGRNE